MELSGESVFYGYTDIHNKHTFFPYSAAFDTENNLKVALKKLVRPFQTIVHAKRTYREFKYLQHMKHENVSLITSVSLVTKATIGPD